LLGRSPDRLLEVQPIGAEIFHDGWIKPVECGKRFDRVGAVSNPPDVLVDAAIAESAQVRALASEPSVVDATIGKVIGSAREGLPFCGDISVHLGISFF
jgi:hypothetical protein